MEQTSPRDFKKFFLLEFTRELINHSSKKDITKLQKIIEKTEERKNPVRQNLFVPNITPEIHVRKMTPVPKIEKLQIKPLARHLLFIPEPKLPPHLQYLKPITATARVDIDLGKLNPLIRDSAVRIIESYPNENVIVIGTMGTKSTSIILSKEEIDDIINKFSEMSKIPANEGIYRVVVGNLILLAIISEVIGSKFIIKKIAPPNFSNKQLIPPLPFQNNLRQR
jgi:hypothetical protein